MPSPSFRMKFEPRHGEAISLTDEVVRVTAPNESPFTFRGTNSYLIGTQSLAVIDPGPARDDHFDALMRAIAGRPVSHIVMTHTHMDHSPLAARLKVETGAITVAQGPHRDARALHEGEVHNLDAAGDWDFQPDHSVDDGEIIMGNGWSLEAIHTPGHAMNHVCYALKGTDVLFSGDHVMAWATSIVAPPDGSMRDYMASLTKMTERSETIYLPGHGGRLENAPEFVRALRAHRKMRETAILARVQKGDKTIPAIVSVLYKETDARLHGAAGLSVFAHLEDLVAKGKVSCEGNPQVTSHFHPV